MSIDDMDEQLFAGQLMIMDIDGFSWCYFYSLRKDDKMING